MASVLIVYNKDGDIISWAESCGVMVDGVVVGYADAEAHEIAGGRLRDIYDVCDVGTPVPPDVFEEVTGRPYQDGDKQPHLPQDHPYRLAHDRVAGASTWPEYLGASFGDFKVELRPGPRGGSPSVRALVHRKSGHRRDRAEIVRKREEAIAERLAVGRAAAKQLGLSGVDVDIRDITGSVEKPLRLDKDGRNLDPLAELARPIPDLPLMSGGRSSEVKRSNSR
jgi:hypothetical protein